jgi:acyl-CoA reductase-like NAD-dependent aldehyde dehydrogenase
MSIQPRDRDYWLEKAATLRFETRPLLDGRFVRSQHPTPFDLVNPALEDQIAEVGEGGGGDIDVAVASAQRAFADGRWSQLAPRVRAATLVRLTELCDYHREELALLDCLNAGKPISQALQEVDAANEYFRFAAEACDKTPNEMLPSAESAIALSVYEPVGVVGAILPWNFPLMVAALKIAPALAVGNCIVVKPSELTPLSALRLGELALEAGVPPGVLNIVPGLGRTAGQALAEHADVDLITFTGSTAIGRTVMQAASGSNLKRVLLECGGKSPQIVFADANLDDAAQDIVQQITWNQGQVCIASSRALVHRDVCDELTERVVALMANVRPGDTLDPETRYGPLVSHGHMNKVLQTIEGAKRAGLRMRTGGGRLLRRGCFVAPTVFDDVPGDAALAQEEAFGPVLAITPFETPQQAIRLANATQYGLSARIWSGDLALCYQLARRLRVGAVSINAAPPRFDPGPALAAEPDKQSGFGIEGGLAGMRQFQRCKSIQFNLPASRFS